MAKRKIDWYYHRRNCAACEKADRALVGCQIAEQVDARKIRFNRAAALKMARAMRCVVATRGTKTVTFDMTAPVDADALAGAIIGPSGNLRAPSLRIGDTLYVGLAPELAGEARNVAAPRAGRSG